MGDIVEFTTYPRHQQTWYRVTSNALRFEIKATGSAVVCLATAPNKISYWIGIGDSGCSHIRGKDRQILVEKETIRILSATEYRGFWLKWFSNTITLARQGTDAPVVSLELDDFDYQTHISKLQYVSFGVGRDSTVHWRVEGGSGRPCATKTTPDIISDMEYKALWLTWCNDTITLGRDPATAIVALKIKEVDTKSASLQYVTFEGGRTSTVHWRIEVPPKLPPAISRPISGGRLHWRPAADQLPDGALIGGFERETLYIMRMKYRGSLTPGIFVPSEGTGYIAWGGEARPAEDFEVLCGFDGIWVPTSGGRIPNGAFEGGYSEVDAERLYVGRAYHNGHLIPGKVQPSHNCLYIPYDGKEVAKKQYEILVDPQDDPRCLDRFVPVTATSDVESEDDNHSDNYNMRDEDEMAYAF